MRLKWASCHGALLAGGFLSAKYNRRNTADTGRLSGANPFGNTKFVNRNWDILDVLKTVAAELDRTPAQVAIAWTLARPGVASTLIGASEVSQIESNVAATEIRFRDDQMDRLEKVGSPMPGFTSGLSMPAIRRMIFGGHDVSGWNDRHR